MLNYNISWQNLVSAVKNFIESAFFITKNIIIPTCYCAGKISEITYTLKPSINLLHKKYCELAFTLSAYDSEENLLDSTSFVFTIFNVNLSTALVGLSFRMKMLRLFQELNKNSGGVLTSELKLVLATTTALLVGLTAYTGMFFKTYLETIDKIADSEDDYGFFKVRVTKSLETEVFSISEYITPNKHQTEEYENSHDGKKSACVDSNEFKQPNLSEYDEIQEPAFFQHDFENASSPAAVRQAVVNNIIRRLSSIPQNSEDQNLLRQLSEQSFWSGGYSASEHHLTLATQMPRQVPSPVEFSNFISLFDLTTFCLLLIWFFVTILCVILIISYYKPGFVLNKKILLQFKHNLQHIQVMNYLNQIRRYVTILIMFFNVVSIGLLGTLWYAFKQTVKYFGL